MTDTEVLEFIIANKVEVKPILGPKLVVDFWSAAYRSVTTTGQNITRDRDFVHAPTLREAVEKLSKQIRVPAPKR